MKGIITILEVALAGTIIVMLFVYFFPQYQSKSEWPDTTLQVVVQDILATIDLTDRTYYFSIDNKAFEDYMRAITADNPTFVWWKQIDNLPNGKSTRFLYFSKAKKSTVIDVVYDGQNFRVYSFTLYIGTIF